MQVEKDNVLRDSHYPSLEASLNVFCSAFSGLLAGALPAPSQAEV